MGIITGIGGFFRLLAGGWLILVMGFGIVMTLASHAGDTIIPRSDPQIFEMTIRDRPDRAMRIMTSFLASTRWTAAGERVRLDRMSDGSIRLTIPHDEKRNLLEVSIKMEPVDGGASSLVTAKYDAAGLARMQGSDTKMEDMNLAVRQEIRRGLITIDEHRVVQRGFSLSSIFAIAATKPASSDD